MADKEVDHVTGVETTGHEWDGVKELNKPLPKWWLYTFYATIVWAFGYWVLYPAWPTLAGYTPGVLGYSQRVTVANEVKQGQDAQKTFRDKIAATPIDKIRADQDLLRFAMASGQSAFANNCAPCHGRAAAGSESYPNLNDDDWIWGGKITDIQQTLQYGIRSGHKQTRDSAMPRFGLDKLLDDKQIDDTAEYVLALSGKSTNKDAAARGQKVFAEQCVACHGDTGKGNPELGAPNLTDGIWLYGGTKAAVVTSIRTGRGGVMPAWEGRLDPVTIKSLSVYVHSLGGGK